MTREKSRVKRKSFFVQTWGASMIRCCIALAGLATLTVLTGCESYDPDAGVIVTGKVTQGGQPINNPRTPVGYGGVEVIFVGDKVRASAFCDASGNFEIVDAGEGVPPGKYKVAIVVHGAGTPGGAVGAPPGGAPVPGGSSPTGDKLEGKLSEQNTKIQFDVPDKVGSKHDVGTIEVNDHTK
jgi:hypothetical protein